MAIVDAKLSRQPGPKADMLHDLYESVRAYQPQFDTTNFLSEAVRKILDLSSIDRLDRTSPTSNAQSARSSAEGPHPSLYLRMALVSTPKIERSGFLGENTPADIGLLRLLGPGLMHDIESILNRDPTTTTTARGEPSARPAPPAPSDSDQAIRQRIAAWTALDQAVSSELGMVSPPTLATGEDRDAQHRAPDAVRHPADEGPSTAAWREAADRAFSEIGDAREVHFLHAFAFKDQVPRVGAGGGGGGGGGAAQGDWLSQEPGQRLHEPEREARGISSEAAQDGEDVDVARLGSPEQVWNEIFQQLKPGTAH